MREMIDFRGRRYAECRRCGVKWYLHDKGPRKIKDFVGRGGAKSASEPPRLRGGEDRDFRDDEVPPDGFVCPICRKKEMGAGAVPETDTKH